MFVKVKFHGLLSKVCPGEYTVDVETAREAIRAVTLQLKEKLIRKDGNLFSCMVKECPQIEDLDKNIQSEELNLYPSFCAAGGGGGIVNIVVGVVLIVIGVALLCTGFGAPLAGYIGATGVAVLGWAAVAVGAIMCLQGISSMMMPKMHDTTTDNGEASHAFGTKQNTTKIGTPIPIGYGKYTVAGHFLSINTQAIDRGSDSPVVGGFGRNSLIEPNKRWKYDNNNRWVEDNDD